MTEPHPVPDSVVPPMPYAGKDGVVPPMPSEVTNERTPAEGGGFRAAMRRMIHKGAR